MDTKNKKITDKNKVKEIMILYTIISRVLYLSANCHFLVRYVPGRGRGTKKNSNWLKTASTIFDPRLDPNLVNLFWLKVSGVKLSSEMMNVNIYKIHKLKYQY